MSGASEGATRFNITNSKIVFAINPWNANAGASFYLSNVRALSERTVEDRLRADREDGEFLAETVRLYDILSASSKRNVENYDGLLAAMFNRTAERIAGDAVSADEEALQKIRGEIDLLDDVYKFATNAVKAAVEQNYRRIAPAYVDRFVSLYDARTADASLVSDMLYVYGRLNAAGRALVDRESFDAYYAGLTERFGVSAGMKSRPSLSPKARRRFPSASRATRASWTKIGRRYSTISRRIPNLYIRRSAAIPRMRGRRG